MLQKKLVKRLKARYDTKMDGNEWMKVSSGGIPLCRIKYNGQFLSNADQNISDEYRSKIADIRMRSLRCGNMSDSANTHRRCKLPMSPITDSLPLSEILCWRQPTAKRTALCSVPGNRTQTATRCSGEITRRTMNMSRNCRITTTERKTNNSIKAEYKMESVRLVQVKDRPFFSAVGQKLWLLCKAL